MPKKIFDTVFNKLSDDKQKLTIEWFSECNKILTYSDIIDNIKQQTVLAERVFLNFWVEVLDMIESTHSPSHPITINGKTSFETISKKYLCNGNPSAIHSNTILFSLINELDLKEIISDAMGYTDIDKAWSNFRDDTIMSDQDRIEILKDAGFANWKFIIWAYFDPIAGENGSSIDPLNTSDVDRCCELLGLPTIWNKYKIGEKIWKLKMQPPGILNKNIPSIADAGWNEFFQVVNAPLSKIKWGWTRPLKTPRGTTGMPEIVMRTWDPNLIKGVFLYLPDFIGKRSL